MGASLLLNRWSATLGLLLLASQVAAQQSSNLEISAVVFNSGSVNGTQLTISRNGDMIPLSPVVPLTVEAESANLPVSIPRVAQHVAATAKAGVQQQPPGLSGQLYADGQTNYLNVTSEQVAFISCETGDYAGNINAVQVYEEAVANNVSAVLLYSHNGGCSTNGALGGYKYVYSMVNSLDTQDMLGALASSSAPLYVTLGGPDVREAGNGNGTAGNSTDNNSPQNTQPPQNPLGPSPSTAVAMVILYSITGVITALFLIIIVTGAIRAHRHPERYGPRAILGRPRQSRARGVGRAILDTIPIVKFGERDPPKPTDIELESGAAASGSVERSQSTAEGNTQHPDANATKPEESQEQAEAERRLSHAEEGISAAAAAGTTGADSGENQQGCSICTDDFEVGQDQRVLPCDHRFHPECIDPWLLNVSGTCPLCRIDLRPQAERTSEELDEHGNQIPREGEELGGLPPPITAEGDSRGSSVRRSLMLGILGIGRPDRLTREERVLALRRYRLQQATQAARRRRESAAHAAQAASDATAAAAVVQTPDSGTRMRLRSVFGIRTRRTGQTEEAGEQAGSSTQQASSTQPASSRAPPSGGNGST